MVTGRISSFQSFGAVDGPGLRCVVFMQGCLLRCAYCHNPETWNIDGGQEIEVSELVKKIERYRPYIIEGGGVTVSGGEPLLQAEFVSELFCQLQALGYHTTLDTSGAGDLSFVRELLKYTDLVLADFKFTKEDDFRQFCKGSLLQVDSFLQLAMECNTDVILRQVIVPSINDNLEDILELKAVASKYSNIKSIELLPFRTLCSEKYKELGIIFPLKDKQECSQETIESLKRYL